MKKFAFVLILLAALTGLTACASPKNNEALLELNENCSFGGVMLGLTAEAMQEKLGEADAVNPTNAGTEYSYHQLDLSVAVDDNKLIKRLSGKNAEFNVFDITVGDELTAAGDILTAQGYTRDAASGWRFNKNEIQIILLTIDGQSVVGFSAEWLDD